MEVVEASKWRDAQRFRDFRFRDPKSPRWRAFLIQNSTLVENYIRLGANGIGRE
jgi:hypothetical protein